MRINVITDDAGNLVAATPGLLAESEQIAAQVGGEGDGGGIVLMPGQTARQIEVADRLFDAENLDELREHLLSS
jgi:hypothetical protein